MSSVALRCLSKRFGNAVAVDNISLHIEHGQLVCLLGPSGCGKTTALRLMAGFIEPTSGEIAIGDRVFPRPSARCRPSGATYLWFFRAMPCGRT